MEIAPIYNTVVATAAAATATTSTSQHKQRQRRSAAAAAVLATTTATTSVGNTINTESRAHQNDNGNDKAIEKYSLLNKKINANEKIKINITLVLR